MQHFKTVVSNDALLSGNSFPIVASRGLSISWLQKWMVIVACHHWCIKLRHIRDMPETLLVVRDGNGNRNSSLTFLFTIWDHPRIPRVSKNMDASCRRKSNNGKRTRKQTWPICSSSARGRNVVHSWTLATGNIRFNSGSALGFHDIGGGASFGSLFSPVFTIFFTPRLATR